ncbi:MAG TPA: hypothetical protein VER11_34770 [Polyangiaceae bacterium]|nr:hypothetical protein [Polyangiaceae bacterium]
MALMAWILACAVSAAASASGSAPKPPSTPLAAAIGEAQSEDAKRHAALLAKLQTADFLRTLDSEADYAEAARLHLHVDQVVEALARNPAPSAQSAFLALTSNPAYLAEDDRVTGLIRASVNVRPAPPALLRFWDRYSRHDDGFTPITIDALVNNGSPPAIALLERKFADPTHPDEDKVAWMHSSVLTHRNDLQLLLGCERLLRSTLKKKLRPQLVETLFDYLPGEWFRPAVSYSPPELNSASPEALKQLGRIGAYALKAVALSPTQKAAVEKRMRGAERLSAPESH